MVFRLTEEPGLACHVDLAALLMQQRRHKVHDDGDEACRVPGASRHAGQKLRRQLVGRQLRDTRVQYRAEQLQILLRQLDREPDELVLYGAVAQHHHEDEAAAVRQDQVEPPRRQPRGPRRHGVGGQIRHLRDELADLGDDLVDLLHLELHRLVDGLGLVGGQAVVLHQLVDVQPVSGRGRDPSGRGVRLLEIAERGEVRHFVADRCGGKVHVRHLRDRLGRDRFRRADIKIYDRPQDLLFPIGKLHVCSSFSS